MLIRPTEEQLADFGEPDFIIYNAGQFPANRFTKGMSSTTSVEINFKRMEMVILGTEYAGEMKKGVFSVMVKLYMHMVNSRSLIPLIFFLIALPPTRQVRPTFSPLLLQRRKRKRRRHSLLRSFWNWQDYIICWSNPPSHRRRRTCLVRYWSLQHRRRLLRKVHQPLRRERTRYIQRHPLRQHSRKCGVQSHHP